MGKKKNKIPKITEEQYFAYITGLKNDAPKNKEIAATPEPRKEIVEGGS